MPHQKNSKKAFGTPIPEFETKYRIVRVMRFGFILVPEFETKSRIVRVE